MQAGRAALGGAALLVAMGGGARGLAAQGQVPSPAEPEVTLDEAIARTLAASPVMATADGARRAAGAATRSATGAFLPSLSVGSGLLHSNQSQVPTAAGSSAEVQTAYSASVSSGLELFDGGRRFAARRAAVALQNAADAGLVQARFLTALVAKQAFYDVLRADQLLAVAAARIAQAERSAEIARARLATGTTTRSDVLRAELELAAAQQAQLAATEQRQAATLALGRLIGADGAVAARSDTAALAPRPLPLSREELEALAAAQAPAVVAARERQRAAAAGVTQARSQWLPSVTAGAGYNVANNVVLPGAPRDGWALSLGLSYPVFNGFRREEQVARARVDATVADAVAADAARQARAEAGRLAGSVALTAERVALAAGAVDLAREDLRVIEARYRVGASTILDLITSQLNQVQAQTNLVGARYDYLLARAGLEAVVGRDL